MDRTNPTFAGTFSVTSWTCPTCVTTVNIFHRSEHIRSRSHLHKLATIASPHPPAPSLLPGFLLWHCEICSETMNIFYRAEHISSEPHRKFLCKTGVLSDVSVTCDIRAQRIPTSDMAISIPPGTTRVPEIPQQPNFHCGICSALIPLVSIGAHLDISAYWLCACCGVRVHADWKNQHLSVCEGVEEDDLMHFSDSESVVEILRLERAELIHTPEVRENNAGKEVVEDQLGFDDNQQAGGPLQRPELSELSMPEYDRLPDLDRKNHGEQHRLNTSHPSVSSAPSEVLGSLDVPNQVSDLPEATMNRRWACEVCEKTMGIDARDSHLKGKKHAKVVQQRNAEGVYSEVHVPATGVGAESGIGGSGNRACTVAQSPAPIHAIWNSQGNYFLAANTPEPTPAVVPSLPPPALALAIPAPLGNWTCTTCALTVSLSNKYEHIRSKRHQEQAKIQWDKGIKQGNLDRAEVRCLRKENETLEDSMGRVGEETKQKNAEQARQQLQRRDELAESQRKWVENEGKRNELDEQQKLNRNSMQDWQKKAQEDLEKWREGAEKQQKEVERIKERQCMEEELRKETERREGEKQKQDEENKKREQGLGAEKFRMREIKRQQDQALWSCDLCQITMSRNVRNAHMTGAMHHNKLMQAQQSAVSSAPPLLPTLAGPSNARGLWECTICNGKMDPNNKASHLAGVKHLTKLSLLDGRSRLSEQPRPPPPPAKEEVSSVWECKICERVMNIDLKSPHLASFQHSKMAKDKEKEVQRKREETLGIERKRAEQQKTKVEREETERRRMEEWKEEQRKIAKNLSTTEKLLEMEQENKALRRTCNICQTTMSPCDWSPHLNGARHRGNVSLQNLALMQGIANA